MTSTDENTLRGGFVNTVVRIGDTVHRTAGPWTPTIHRLLTHVRSTGLLWVPEPLGMDELGREVLSFIAGEVPHDMPNWVWSDSVLADVASALRQWHDATQRFDHSGSVWNLAPPGPNEVVCHNDFAPYNCVFLNQKFAGAIDFDLCAPGPRVWDIAYTAYRFVPLMPGPDGDRTIAGERCPFTSAVMLERLEKFLDSYGREGDPFRYRHPEVFQATIDRLHAIALWTEDHARTAGVVALERHAAMYRAHASWLSTWRGAR